ncbi:SDR family NAD(P)-dependent oxidoreductase, partial [Secundilactobacillus paracollinoides]|uniref:SDR family NAD(P)-dependent oxidoreductase n=1 Tax=Secundilactobacillus paracollinoides TaxID=240427 RepID=UPI0006D2942C
MKTALITGAGRHDGIGFEVAKELAAKGYHVIISARQQSQIDDRVAELNNQNLSASGLLMDITSQESVDIAVKVFTEQFKQLDVLVNDAAYFGDFADIVNTNFDQVEKIFKTNLFGSWRVAQAFYPFLKQAGSSRLVNVSSGAGSYDDPVYGLLRGSMGMDASEYALTKLALNGLTIKMAREFEKDGIIVNAICPGVVNTHPDAGFGGRDVEEGADGIVWAATLPDGAATGGFYRDKKPLPW